MFAKLHKSAQNQSSSPRALVLHGLLGNTRNWLSVAKTLSEPPPGASHSPIDALCMDWRNHGKSPHIYSTPHSIQSLSQDLTDVLLFNSDGMASSCHKERQLADVWGPKTDNMEWTIPTKEAFPEEFAVPSRLVTSPTDRPPLFLIAHSMGGAAAMHALCSNLELWEKVSGAVIVDIGPCQRPPYTRRLQDAVKSLQSIPLNSLSSRKEVESWLLLNGPQHVFRPKDNTPTTESIWLARYLLSNLSTSGNINWEINLDSIGQGLEKLAWELNPPLVKKCPIPTMFIFGGSSPYLTETTAQESIPKFFERSEIKVIPNAGHFLFLDRRKEFCEIVSKFCGGGYREF